MYDISRETIEEAASGNLTAFEDIYKKTSLFIYNVSLRMLHSKEDAQDLTQDVFVTVYRKLGSYRFESSLKTWLYRITFNMAVNYLKKRNKDRDRTIPYEDTISSERNEIFEKSENTSPDSDQEEMVQKMLDVLNPEQRTCIILRSIEGLSYQEIATSLNISINTVRSRLKRAREKLIALRNEVKKNEL